MNALTFLRLGGLAAVVGCAWFGQSTDWDDSSGVGGVDGLLTLALPLLLGAVGAVLVLRDDPRFAFVAYAGAAILALKALVALSLLPVLGGDALKWFGALVVAATGFLAIAGATSILMSCVDLALAGYERREIVGPYGPRLGARDIMITVWTAMYTIPIGVAVAVLVGTVVPGWWGAAAGLVVGVGVGVLASNGSIMVVWRLVDDEPDLSKAASRLLAALAGLSVGVPASIIVGASAASEFVLLEAVELAFALLVVGVLVWPMLLIEVSLLDRGIGRVPMMALLALVCGALGVFTGILAGELLSTGVSERAVENAVELAVVLGAAAVVAFFLQRLASVIGFTALAVLATIEGSDGWTIAASGIVGAFAGAALSALFNVLLASMARNIAFRGLVYGLGVIGGIIVGVTNGLAVLS